MVPCPGLDDLLVVLQLLHALLLCVRKQQLVLVLLRPTFWNNITSSSAADAQRAAREIPKTCRCQRCPGANLLFLDFVLLLVEDLLRCCWVFCSPCKDNSWLILRTGIDGTLFCVPAQYSGLKSAGKGIFVLLASSIRYRRPNSLLTACQPACGGFSSRGTCEAEDDVEALMQRHGRAKLEGWSDVHMSTKSLPL